MSATRLLSDFAEFEHQLQNFEAALDGVIQSQDNISQPVPNQNGVSQYPHTTIANQPATSLALQAWNVLALVKGFLALLKTNAGVLELDSRNNEVYAGGSALYQSIEKVIAEINEVDRENKNKIKELVEAAKLFLSFFFENKNISLLINHLKESALVTGLSFLTKGTVIGKINTQEKNLPARLQEVSHLLSQLSSHVEEQIDESQPKEVDILIVDQSVESEMSEFESSSDSDEQASAMDEEEDSFEENVSIEELIYSIKENQEKLKEEVKRLNTSLHIQEVEENNKKLKKKIEKVSELSVAHGDKLRKTWNDEKIEVEQRLKSAENENEQLNSQMIAIGQEHQKDALALEGVNNFINKYEEIIQRFSNHYVYIDFKINQALESELPLSNLKKILEKDLVRLEWEWTSGSRKEWDDFFSAEKERLIQNISENNSKIRELGEKFVELRPLKEQIKEIKEEVDKNITKLNQKEREIKAQMDELNKENKEIQDGIEEAWAAVDKRRDQVEIAKQQLAHYLEVRHNSYKALDFFEEVVERISKAFGGHYKSQQTERREYVENLCDELDNVSINPAKSNITSLTSAIQHGISLFKPRVAHTEVTASRYKETLQGCLTKINKDLGKVI